MLAINNDKFGLPPMEKLLSYKVVVCGCIDAGILVTAKATNMELMRTEHETYQALHPRGTRSTSPHEVHPHWTHLLIDEVSILAVPGPVLILNRLVKVQSRKSLFPCLSYCPTLSRALSSRPNRW
jgi:hypothetical protein